MNKIKYIFVSFLVFTSCLNDNDDNLGNTLDVYILNKSFEMGAVIACAASDEKTNDVLTFYYPEAGAINIRFYETQNAQVNKDDFSNYLLNDLYSEPLFNGYLGRFPQSSPNEKWVIVTFELDGEIKISNPIRIKHLTKPTVWNDEVAIDQSQSGMPNFKWEHNAFGDNAIYFQVVSDEQNNLLSGTYTYDNDFQYYDISNVVLNVTTDAPPELIIGNSYNFTLMDVSEDNWVNWVIQKTFDAQ
ncbi:hypothetical protein L3X37_04785 [Sabulilitoribacter arenilitoris]|uniref:Uncharacterized protein n=1 Tax=Wocania arenilitoris TaxID=2044858 RepID=A0AAE3ELN4_9FLAO|nr:hypothetical protein [Wocania arenilitoris]MCF7567680.1 hypothetical protein [Wocania arenilitoris]